MEGRTEEKCLKSLLGGRTEEKIFEESAYLLEGRTVAQTIAKSFLNIVKLDRILDGDYASPMLLTPNVFGSEKSN